MRIKIAFLLIFTWFALTFLGIQYVNSQTMPKSVIKTVLETDGFHLVCEGECSYFDSLLLDDTLRFEYGYQAVNYMYSVINSKENAKLGPLTPAD